jgi:maleylpyruvate isomerase
MTEGHRYFVARMAQVDDAELFAPTALPGWTGRHILSHVGHNARAIGRLAHWATTGEPTPMYSGQTARAAEIALGAGWEPERLRSFVVVEQDALVAALEKLDVEQWAAEVVTAQGRHVSAAALPWLRTRELWVHAADLHGLADFSDFPPALLDELIIDVLRFRRDARRETLHVRPTDRDPIPPLGGTEEPPVWIEGRTADLVRWLTGRGVSNLRASDHSGLPALGPWL